MEAVPRKNNADLILDTALELAESKTWERLQLHDIASTLGIGLDEIRQHYPQKDDLVERWYDRADNSMLKFADKKELAALSVRERLGAIIMAWLEALGPHRKVSGEMLWYKLEPGHIHLQAQGLLRISRTVQWFREAAGRDNSHLSRILEEIGLTGIFLSTFSYWLRDDSANFERTRKALDRKLRRAERLASTLGRLLPGATPGTAGETQVNR